MNLTRVAVVGAGPNGLAAAVTLARAGLAVDVFERNGWTGGGAATRELSLPGFRHDVASAVHPMALASPFFQEFDLARRIDLVVPEASFAHPLPGGRSGIGYRDLDRAADALGADGDAYRSFLGPVVERLRGVTDMTMNTLLRVPRDPIAAAVYGARVLEAGTPAWSRRFVEDVAPAMLTGCAAHTIGRHPTLAMAGGGLMLSATAHAQGWPVPVGGSQAIVDALVADLEAHGGRVHLGREVTDLAQLDEYDAAVLDVGVPAFLTMGAARLPDRYRRALERFKPGSGVSKVDMALAGPVPWSDPRIGEAPTVHLGGTREQIAAAENDVARGRVPERPYVLAVQPSIADSTRAPAGQATFWAYVHVPFDSDVDATEAVLAAVEEHAPGFRDLVLASTATRADEFAAAVSPNFAGGDFASGAVTMTQMLKRPVVSPTPWRTPADGVYLASGATTPGPSVHGMCGWHAARTLLHDNGIPAPNLAPTSAAEPSPCPGRRALARTATTIVEAMPTSATRAASATRVARFGPQAASQAAHWQIEAATTKRGQMMSETRPKQIHAFTDDALGDMDATALADAIDSGRVSATEAVEAALARAEKVDGVLNAIEFIDAKRARQRAGRIDAGLGGGRHDHPDAALRGVPSAFKDNVVVAGVPMTQGSEAMPRVSSRRSGKVVTQILGTGIVPIGTTTMPPFGWTATTERPGGNVTRNPWDTSRSSGGSSGGSAALVASGAVPIAHGNDGGGSIRIPAATCGLVGLKPTRGRLIIGESSAQMPVKIVTDSVLTRTVRDTVTFFEDAQRVHPARRLPPIDVTSHPELTRPLRIGFMHDSPFAPASDAPTRAAVDTALTMLGGLGHDIVDWQPTIPESFQQDFLDYWGFLAFNTVAGGKRLFHKDFDASKLDPLTLGLAQMGRRRLAHAPKFLARLQASGRVYRSQMASGPDVFVSPVLAHVAPEIGYLAGDLDYETHLERVLAYCAFTPLHNATGAPAISLPLGRTDDGLPVGVMISGQIGDENTLLRLALQIEAAHPFRRLDQVGEAAQGGVPNRDEPGVGAASNGA